MSSIDYKASISVHRKFLPENPRIGDHKHIAIGLEKPTPSGTSLLREWAQQGSSPFSLRHLTKSKENAGAPKTARKSLTDELITIRHRLTPEAYRNIMDVIETVSRINEEIAQSSLLTLTPKDKNIFQGKLMHYQEHTRWVLNGFENARFAENVRIGVELVKRELVKTLRAVDTELQRVKLEPNPGSTGPTWLRV